MRKVNNKAAKVLATLTAGLTPGDGRKIDNGGGYMPVHVDCIAPNHYCVAHTYIQNGDVMDDPSMDFFHAPNGNWYPMTFTQHSIGLHQVGMTATPKADGSFEYKGRWRLQKDHAVFAGTWMKNIKAQQGSLTATGRVRRLRTGCSQLRMPRVRRNDALWFRRGARDGSNMDPNANILEQVRLAEAIAASSDPTTICLNAERLAELVIALDEWLSSGGFRPKRWS